MYDPSVRIVILSDVHSNLDALDAVLRDAEARGTVDAIWCLGDIVGYGAEPHGVIAWLRSRGAAAVGGNHDLAACGRMDVAMFNPAAADAALWTRRELREDERRFLAELPLVRVQGSFTMVHGSLRSPEWEYLLSSEQAAAQFQRQTTAYSLIGHSHLPFWVEERDGAQVFRGADDGTALVLGDTRLIVNPGGAGQPRDGDPRAAYVLYDEDAATLTWHRVEYDVAAAQRKILAAGLHPWLAERLAIGQ